jgi:hypothetical protein
MFFRSAVDPWVYALVVSLPAVLLRAVIPALAGANSTVVFLTAIALVPLTLLPVWLLMFTYYRVDSVILRIQAGPFSWSVPLEQIRSITLSRSKLSRSMVSSPALSLNRLKIEYGRQRSVLVSPKNRAAFIEALGRQPDEILSDR